VSDQAPLMSANGNPHSHLQGFLLTISEENIRPPARRTSALAWIP
jgi:hypothetical protein